MINLIISKVASMRDLGQRKEMFREYWRSVRIGFEGCGWRVFMRRFARRADAICEFRCHEERDVG